jgi:hypothetical protein
MRIRRGRHAMRRASMKLGMRPVIGTFIGVCAAVMAITLVVTSATGHATPRPATRPNRAPHLTFVHVTTAERDQLRHYLVVPKHRAEFSSLIERSFKQAGIKTGTNSIAVPGRTSLDVAYGVTGYHVWAIVSFADVYDGAVSAMTTGCTALLYKYDLKWFTWVCGWMGTELSKWSAGRAWAANHGVWVAVYWLPYIYYQMGYW